MHMVHAYRKFPQATVFCWVGVGGGGDLGVRLVFLHMGGRRHWWEGKGYSGAWKRVEGMKLRIMEGMENLHLVCVFSGSHIRIPRPFVYLGCQSHGNISLGMGRVT